MLPIVDLPELTRDEMQRYSRHLLLPEVGAEGQRRLKAARVLLVGAGGLGSPIALYLGAAGIGKLGIVDFDVVDESNLQRQVLHGTGWIGKPKLDSARARLEDINPHVHVETYPTRLDEVNAIDIIREYDVIVDGTDNFAARYIVNDTCVLLGRPYVYGSVFRFDGQVSLFATKDGPCYRCVYPSAPPPDLVPNHTGGGLLGVLPGIIGIIQATETLKVLLDKGDSLIGRLLLVDILSMSFREMTLNPNPDCPVCGCAANANSAQVESNSGVPACSA